MLSNLGNRFIVLLKINLKTQANFENIIFKMKYIIFILRLCNVVVVVEMILNSLIDDAPVSKIQNNESLQIKYV